MIKRYDFEVCCMSHCLGGSAKAVENGFRSDDGTFFSDGEWVKYEDHEHQVKELERRVRWLESIILKADAHSWESELQDCADTVSDAVQIIPNHQGGRLAVKPTPEDFK